MSIAVDCFGTEKIALKAIKEKIRKDYDLTPAGIISFLKLLEINYNDMSSYGHFFNKVGLNLKMPQQEGTNKKYLPVILRYLINEVIANVSDLESAQKAIILQGRDLLSSSK